MISGRATLEGTERFAARSSAASGHFREAAGLLLSSIGLGTYLGREDAATDLGYEESVGIALSSGVNVFDSAINYRGQKSERAIGRALAKAFENGTARRDETFVATKGGYLPHDADDLHNIESQTTAVERPVFRVRLVKAVEALEEAASSGRIGSWGLATWDGLRVPPEHPEHISLADARRVAEEVAGDGHHFAAVQLPVNLAMAQAVGYRSQELGEERLPALIAAERERLAVFGSASLLQGRLAADLPEEVEAAFPDAEAGAQQALQFSRSAPGMTTALVGVSTPGHARENFRLAGVPPAERSRVLSLFE